MVIVETSVFTRQVQALLSDDEYRQLQAVRVERPDLGPVIPGGGGIRKVRWATRGQGKRGGARVIYYWAVAHDQLLMLFMYAKSEQEDLTPGQIKILRKVVEDEYP
ncbi:MAG: hypothetical protein CVU38_08170 [Chloroflexi bacterium HGW-Chloroflexi-1]|nr:MAG: hypothetical protein CVU38_08170 [Chloroflexi bacterium HGW-Chloroflexi-1]